jgi:hypothetical protein
MNANKGQMAIASIVVLLVAGVIGMMVLAEFTGGFCNCIAGTRNETLLNDTAVDFECQGKICEVSYVLCDDVYLNQTHLAIPGEYTRDGCEFTLTDDTYDGMDCQLGYTYEGDYYAGDTILGTIVCLLPVLIALGLLFFAIGWAALK